MSSTPLSIFVAPLDLVQWDYIYLVLSTPELDAVSHMRSHQSRAEGQNQSSWPAGHAFDAAQDTVVFLGWKCTLLGHVEFFVNQQLHIILLRAAANWLPAQPVFVLGIALTHAQDLHLALWNFMGSTSLLQAHLSKSLRATSLPSSMPAAAHSLMLLTNLLRVPSISLSMSPTRCQKILNYDTSMHQILETWMKDHEGGTHKVPLATRTDNDLLWLAFSVLLFSGFQHL